MFCEVQIRLGKNGIPYADTVSSLIVRAKGEQGVRIDLSQIERARVLAIEEADRLLQAA